MKFIGKAKAELGAAIEEVVAQYFPREERPAVAVAFVLSPDYDVCHWVTNVGREDGIKLFKMTADKMQSELN